MQSQENKKELAITILKKAIQETQQELLLAAEDLKFQEFKDSILHFNRLVQRDFITKLTLDSEEEVQQIYASASADLKDEVNASTPLKTAYQRVLDWYHLRIMDAFLERKEGILYKSKAADKKNEEKKRADLVRRLKDSKDAIKNFNTILRKEHVTYKIKNVRSLPDAPLDKCFESLIKEENEYELSLDNSSYLLNLMKEREILLKKVVSLQEEAKAIIQGFTLKQKMARDYRLKKIAEILQNQGGYLLDVYYLNDFHQTTDMQAKQKIDNYKKIQERNYTYERICELKKEANKLEVPLQDFLKNIEEFYQKMNYMDWLWPSAEISFIDKVYIMLKRDSATFAEEAKIIKAMRDISESYRIIQDDVPKFNQIVIDEFIQHAANYTKELQHKISEYHELCKIEDEIAINQEKEKKECLADIFLDVGADDVDPIRIKELHRRKLDQEWKLAFMEVLQRETQPLKLEINKLNKNELFVADKLQEIQESVFLKRDYIKNQCLLRIQAIEKRQRIEDFLLEEFNKLPIFQDIKNLMENTAEKKSTAVETFAVMPMPALAAPQNAPENLSFLRKLWNKIKNFLAYFCCRPCLKPQLPLNKPSQEIKNLSYRTILQSKLGEEGKRREVSPDHSPSPDIKKQDKKIELDEKSVDMEMIKPLTLG